MVFNLISFHGGVMFYVAKSDEFKERVANNQKPSRAAHKTTTASGLAVITPDYRLFL